MLDFCEVIVDCEHKTAPTQPTGFPSIRTPNVGRGRLILNGVNHVSQETYEEWTRREVPRSGDLILAREAPAGNIAMIPKNLQVCLGQRTVLIRANADLIEPSYLLYLLLEEKMQSKLLSYGSGATVAHVNMSDIRALELPELPSRKTQERIAEILSAYDDLIENNTRRIKILEEMAKLIYREWFVEFKAPGVKLRKATAEEKKVTGKDVFPEGWELRNLFDIAEVIYGYPFKGDKFSSEKIGKPVIRIRNLKNQSSEIFTTESAQERHELLNGDILVGMDGDFSVVTWAGGSAYQNQRIVKFRPKEATPAQYLALSLEKPIHFFDSTVTGTTVAHLSDEDLRSVSIVLPSSQVMQSVRRLFDDIYQLKINLFVSNANLRQTRDLLLPKLVSGEVEV